MSEISVQLKDGAVTQILAPVSAGEALKRLDREAAKQALAARVNGREVDLAFCNHICIYDGSDSIDDGP